MIIVDQRTGESYEVQIMPVRETDYKSITKARFWFDWKEEMAYDVFKLCIKDSDNILGLISLNTVHDESRIEIRLLAISKENRGRNKHYVRIAGNLIAFAGIQAIRLFGAWACVSQVPKTTLVKHYMKTYRMLQAGKSLFLDGRELIQLILTYDHD